MKAEVPGREERTESSVAAKDTQAHFPHVSLQDKRTMGLA